MGFTITAPDGSRRQFEAIGRPIRDDRARGGIVVIRDITERSLHRMQNEFMALASHELRTPLTPLTATLQLLLHQLADQPEDSPLRHHVEVALRQTRRLTRLVDDLLDASRLQTGRLSLERRPTSLNELVAQTVEMAQSLTTSQRIAYVDAPEAIVADADGGRLQQVLLNLLNNAIIYAPNSDQIEVRLQRADGDAEIQVQDYGPGIAASEIPHLFSRFFQVARTDRPARRGLGLGLYITRQVVEAHGGTVTVQSTEGEGTTFTVCLPLE
jgi:two-component system CheB/CheR fusion protein